MCLKNPSSHQSPQDIPAQAMIDQRIQALILSSFQALPIPLPQFRQPEGTLVQQIQKHQENLAIAQRLLQIHQLQAFYNIGQLLQDQPYIRSAAGITIREARAAKRIYTLFKRNVGALVQAHFYLNDIQQMNEITFQSTLQQVDILFPEEPEEDLELEWSDPDTEGDDGTGIDAEDAYAYWNDD